MNEKNREEVQKKVFELNMLREKLQEMEQQRLVIGRQLEALKQLVEDLDEVSMNEGKEMMSPLGAGVFVKSKVADAEKVLVNIGSNCILEKKIPDAKRIVEEHSKKVKGSLEMLEQQISEINSGSAQIEKEVSELAQRK